jgi:uncharacterized C2H2 Zn-finger protein
LWFETNPDGSPSDLYAEPVDSDLRDDPPALDSLSPTGRRTPTDPPVLLEKIELIHSSRDGGLVLTCPQWCNAQFTGRWRARNLKKHVAHNCSVTQSRPDYQRASCPRCGQTFTRPDNLKQHMAGPCPGYQRASCPYCGQTFTKPDHLHPHVKRKHPTSP